MLQSGQGIGIVNQRLNRTELCCVKLTLCLYWLLMEALSS